MWFTGSVKDAGSREFQNMANVDCLLACQICSPTWTTSNAIEAQGFVIGYTFIKPRYGKP